MIGTFLTDRGKVRTHNEDAGGIFYNESNQLLAIIADGMGGHQAGDVASQMAINAMKERWEETKRFSSPEEVETWLKKHISEVNALIYRHAQSNKECEGMGTTIVSAVCLDEHLIIAHIGDSRCYVFRQQTIEQVTEDHSLVNALVQSGQLSKDDAATHPRRNVVLRALGSEEKVNIDVQTVPLEKGIKVLLCSDGLTDKIRDEELSEIVPEDKPIEEIGRKLIDLANERGGEDNISLILLVDDAKVEAGEKVEKRPPSQ